MPRALQRDLGDDLRLQRIVDAHDHQPAVARDVRVIARRSFTKFAPLSAPSGLNVSGPFEEVVPRIAVEQCRGVDQDQPSCASAT